MSLSVKRSTHNPKLFAVHDGEYHETSVTFPFGEGGKALAYAKSNIDGVNWIDSIKPVKKQFRVSQAQAQAQYDAYCH